MLKVMGKKIFTIRRSKFLLHCNAHARLNMVYFTIFGPDFEQDNLW